MSYEVVGFVESLSERQVNTKFGPKPAYSIQVRTDDGETEWFGCAFTRPKCREGSRIKFSAEKNARGYLDADVTSIEVLKEGAAPAAGASNNAGSKALNNRDKSITLQSASKVAVDMLNGMLESGILTFSTGTKASKENAQEAYVEYHKRLAYDLQAMFLDPDAHDPTGAVEDGVDHGEFED